MAGRQTLLAVDITMLRGSVPSNGSLESRFKCAMKAAMEAQTFSGGNAEERLKIAIGVMMCEAVDEDERERIKQECRVMNAMSAALSGGTGTALDFLSAVADNNVEPSGILKLWHEVLDEQHAHGVRFYWE